MRLANIAAAVGLAAAAIVSSAVAFPPQAPLLPATSSTHQVELTLGVMSRCPDAFLVEALIDQTLADERVKGKVALELVYIGMLDNDAPGGITCKHGELECDGNVQQLCVQAYLNQSDWWPFVVCQDGQPARIGTTGLAEECAAQVGFEWSGEIRRCAEEGEGQRRLRESVRRTQEMGIEKSATILLGKEHKVRLPAGCLCLA